MDDQPMRRALALAGRGRGSVEPNPLVGAVLLHERRVVAEGWHRAFGEPHAEIEAIRSLGNQKADTLYVNLEPCHHPGKTPPCTEAIPAAGIEKVVFGMRDPNPDVRGGGAEALRSRGIEVVEGSLPVECRKLNVPFTKWVTKKLPYVTAKWAMTLDGRMATPSGDSKWISCEASRKIVHDLRGEVDAILVGVGTVLQDDPRLNCRTEPKRVARRIVADSQARTPPGCAMLQEKEGGEVIIAVTERAPNARISALEDAGAKVWVIPGQGDRVDLDGFLARIGVEGATHLLVEAGPTLLGSLFRAEQVDRVLCFIAPKILGGEGRPVAGWSVEVAGEPVSLDDMVVRRVEDDILVEGVVVRPGA
ncbi:MAG: bifunctional diaminohydroxyphosphoribosylaminopyrimidine deaminase/5-amino-6-(5-phosphoribosylamino)uracil reductase RibD [Planctomycetota bacterium]|nr:bifunctional diaminohydroxyphosphoribosylaminopyrimidine deaminase/5-amino-6-(5-phosphoribosylamino)uracil reductase RibD [Planctomycetota bacterium]